MNKYNRLHIHLFNSVPKYILTNLIIFFHYKINKVYITIHTKFKRYKNTRNNDNWFLNLTSWERYRNDALNQQSLVIM